MPRKRRRLKRRRETGWNQGHITHLLEGYASLGEGFGEWRHNGEREDTEAMRRAWEELREELMAAWIKENPGHEH